ncbi:MAG: class I SAM-dependent methyltransferase [Rhodocyclaceae bacterium]
MTDFTSTQIDAGQAIYTPLTLKLYDLVVLGISNRFIWRCPTRSLLGHYNAHISGKHLDIGVGTGYFLDRCRFSLAQPAITLMDLNEHALQHAAQRIARYRPATVVQNVLLPFARTDEKYDSVGMNYLLHCVPGSIAQKAVAFDHVKAVMNPGATIFGATLLQGGVPRNLAARKLMAAYNRKGVFCNEQDDLAGLVAALNARFSDVTVSVQGCAAVFAGKA